MSEHYCSCKLLPVGLVVRGFAEQTTCWSPPLPPTQHSRCGAAGIAQQAQRSTAQRSAASLPAAARRIGLRWGCRLAPSTAATAAPPSLLHPPECAAAAGRRCRHPRPAGMAAAEERAAAPAAAPPAAPPPAAQRCCPAACPAAAVHHSAALAGAALPAAIPQPQLQAARFLRHLAAARFLLLLLLLTKDLIHWRARWPVAAAAAAWAPPGSATATRAPVETWLRIGNWPLPSIKQQLEADGPQQPLARSSHTSVHWSSKPSAKRRHRHPPKSTNETSEPMQLTRSSCSRSMTTRSTSWQSCCPPSK